MTDTTTGPYALTRQDIRALRAADSVTFHLYQGRASVRAHQERHNSSTGFDQTHEIPATATVISYQKGEHGRPTDMEAFHMIHSARFNYTWPSILARILPNSTLHLAWTRGNDTEAHTAVSFHADELHLSISRNGKSEGYLVAYSVGPDNTARMVGKEKA